MDMQSIIRLALRNVIRQWRYSLSSLLVLASGLIALILLKGFIYGLTDLWTKFFEIRHMFADVVIESAIFDEGTDQAAPIPSEGQRQLDKILKTEASSIAQRVRFLEIEGELSLLGENAAFSGLGYDRDAGEAVRGSKWQWNAYAGEPLKRRGDVVLGRILSSNLGCVAPTEGFRHLGGDQPGYLPENRPILCGDRDGRGEKVFLQLGTDSGRANGTLMTYRGIVDAGYPEYDRMWLMMDLADAQRLVDSEKISWMTLRLRPRVSPQTFIGATQDRIRQLGLRIMPWSEHRHAEYYRRFSKYLWLLEVFVTTILYAIICLATFNVMVKIIDERTPEIGLLQCIGYPKTTIRNLFFIETAIIIVSGLVLGSVVALGIAAALNAMEFMYEVGIFTEPLPFFIKISGQAWSLAAFCLFCTAFVSMAAAIWRSLHRTVIECLLN